MNANCIEDLLKLDRELDSRFSDLCMKGKITEVYKLEPNTLISNSCSKLLGQSIGLNCPEAEEDGKGKHHEVQRQEIKEDHKHLEDIKNKDKSHYIVKTGSSNEIQSSQNGENYVEQTSSDEEHSLSGFLTHATKLKMKSLMKKCEHLEKALAVSQEKIKSMNGEISESNKVAKEAFRKVTASKRSLSSKEKLLQRKEKEHKYVREEMLRKTQQYQKLSKEMHQLEKNLKEEERRKRIFQNENENLKIKLNEVKKKMVDEIDRNKEEREGLLRKISESEESFKGLQKHLFTLTTLMKKQEQLISVLQQKNLNIASAKITKGLEEEFLSLVEPFVVNKDTGGSAS